MPGNFVVVICLFAAIVICNAIALFRVVTRERFYRLVAWLICSGLGAFLMQGFDASLDVAAFYSGTISLPFALMPLRVLLFWNGFMLGLFVSMGLMDNPGNSTLQHGVVVGCVTVVLSYAVPRSRKGDEAEKGTGVINWK